MLITTEKSTADLYCEKFPKRSGKLDSDYVPGEELFGPYRFLPIFFCLGAALEYTMINWKPGGRNFYETFKKRNARETALKQLKLLGELDGIDEEELAD